MTVVTSPLLSPRSSHLPNHSTTTNPFPEGLPSEMMHSHTSSITPDVYEAAVPANILLSGYMPPMLRPTVWQSLKSAGGVGLLGGQIGSDGMQKLGRYLSPSREVKTEAIRLVHYIGEAVGKSPLPVKRFFVGGDYGDRSAVGTFKDLKMLVYLKDVLPPYHVPFARRDPHSSHDPSSSSAIRSNSSSAHGSGMCVLDLLFRVLDSHFQAWREFAEFPHPSISKPARRAVVSSSRLILRPHWVEVHERHSGLCIKVAPVPWISHADDSRTSLDHHPLPCPIQLHTKQILGYLCLNDGSEDESFESIWGHCLEEARCLLFQNLPDLIQEYIRFVKYLLLANDPDVELPCRYVETMALLSVIPPDTLILARPSIGGDSSDSGNLMWSDILMQFDPLSSLKVFLLSLSKPPRDFQAQIDWLSNMVVSTKDGSLDLAYITQHRRRGLTYSSIFELGQGISANAKLALLSRTEVLFQRLGCDSEGNQETVKPSMSFQQLLAPVEGISKTTAPSSWRTTRMLLLFSFLSFLCVSFYLFYLEPLQRRYLLKTARTMIEDRMGAFTHSCYSNLRLWWIYLSNRLQSAPWWQRLRDEASRLPGVSTWGMYLRNTFDKILGGWPWANQVQEVVRHLPIARPDHPAISSYGLTSGF